MIYDELDLAFSSCAIKSICPDLVSRTVYRAGWWPWWGGQSGHDLSRGHPVCELLLVGKSPGEIPHSAHAGGYEAGGEHPAGGFHDLRLCVRTDGAWIMLLSETYYNHHNYTGLRAIAMDSPAACITHEAVWNRERPTARWSGCWRCCLIWAAVRNGQNEEVKGSPGRICPGPALLDRKGVPVFPRVRQEGQRRGSAAAVVHCSRSCRSRC